MIRVSITKDQIVTHRGTFQTQEEADAWISQGVAENWWGLPERLEIGEDGLPTGVILPCEYEITQEDVSVETAQVKEREEALAYLAATDWYIIREADAGTPCPTEIKEARAAARLKI